MNTFVETAIISNLKDAFPNAIVYTGKVIQGVKPNDIILNSVSDEFEVLLGSPLRLRRTSASVSIVNPSENVTDTLVSSLQSFNTENGLIFADTIDISDEDGLIIALVSFIHLER